MVPPPVMSAAAQRHDDAVASCLSLLLDKRRDPLQELEESGDEDIFSAPIIGTPRVNRTGRGAQVI